MEGGRGLDSGRLSGSHPETESTNNPKSRARPGFFGHMESSLDICRCFFLVLYFVCFLLGVSKFAFKEEHDSELPIGVLVRGMVAARALEFDRTGLREATNNNFMCLPQLFSGSLFPLFLGGGCPTKMVFPKKGSLVSPGSLNN